MKFISIYFIIVVIFLGNISALGYMADFFEQVKNRFYILTLTKNVNEKNKIYRRTDYFNS